MCRGFYTGALLVGTGDWQVSADLDPADAGGGTGNIRPGLVLTVSGMMAVIAVFMAWPTRQPGRSPKPGRVR